jgi:hypothetical protein
MRLKPTVNARTCRIAVVTWAVTPIVVTAERVAGGNSGRVIGNGRFPVTSAPRSVCPRLVSVLEVVCANGRSPVRRCRPSAGSA